MKDKMLINGMPLNIKHEKRGDVWNPSEAFLEELKITKLRLEIKPRKHNIMQAQIGMIADMMSEEPTKKLYVPVNGSYK